MAKEKKMTRKEMTRNRTNKNIYTPSQQRKNANNAIDGRGGRRLTSYTGGARSVSYKSDNAAAMRDAWEKSTLTRNSQTGRYQKAGTEGRVATITHTANGRMSVDGKHAGGMTHGFSHNTGDGHGKGELLTRRQRYYQVRVGLGLSGG